MRIFAPILSILLRVGRALCVFINQLSSPAVSCCRLGYGCLWEGRRQQKCPVPCNCAVGSTSFSQPSPVSETEDLPLNPAAGLVDPMSPGANPRLTPSSYSAKAESRRLLTNHGEDTDGVLPPPADKALMMEALDRCGNPPVKVLTATLCGDILAHTCGSGSQQPCSTFLSKLPQLVTSTVGTGSFGRFYIKRVFTTQLHSIFFCERALNYVCMVTPCHIYAYDLLLKNTS